MDKKTIIKIMSPLLCGYPTFKMDESMVQVYTVALSDLTEDQLSAAVMRCLRTCKFFPAIAEIREAAESLTDHVNGTGAKSPDEAWREVQQQMHDAFVYKPPVFSTPEIEQAALAMGWEALCTTDNPEASRAHFLKMYASVCARTKNTKVNTEVLRILGGGKLLTGGLN